jgi:hypothetical protein
MATGSGLDAQLGTKTETTVGTIAAPVTNFFPFNSAQLTFTPSYIDNPGITAGKRFKSVSQVGIARKMATGTIQIPLMNVGLGWWFKHLLGSTNNPVVIGATTAFKQIHTPAGLRGLSFTAQIGKPEPGTGTVQPRTYNGCKITDWTFTLQDNSLHLLDMTVDSWNEDTATGLATATYPTASQAFTFANVTAFKTGGTPTTSAGETSITSCVTVPSVATKFTLSGKATLATDRFGLGNAGVKKEQFETDFFDLSGTFDGEFDATTWEGVNKNNTTVPLQITSSFGDAGGGNPFLFDIIIPAAKITAAPAPVSGPGLVAVSGTFQVYDPNDGVNPPLQIKLVSTDSAAWT